MPKTMSADRFAVWEKTAQLQVWLTAALGLGCLVAPGLLLALFGTEATAGTVVFLRAFGVSLFFVALMHHATKRSRDVRVVRGVIVANLVEDGLLCLLSVLALASGTFAPTGLLLVAAFGGEVALNAWLLTRFMREGD